MSVRWLAAPRLTWVYAKVNVSSRQSAPLCQLRQDWAWPLCHYAGMTRASSGTTCIIAGPQISQFPSEGRDSHTLKRQTTESTTTNSEQWWTSALFHYLHCTRGHSIDLKISAHLSSSFFLSSLLTSLLASLLASLLKVPLSLLSFPFYVLVSLCSSLLSTRMPQM